MHEVSYEYIGDELELFSAAKNWKQYVAKLIQPYIKGDVLEAGAGIGTNTLLFFNNKVSSWVLLEPDKKNFTVLQTIVADKKLPANASLFNGFTTDIDETKKFDTILYIDVIEHIEDDKSEITTAINLLKPNGHLIVLSPAHNYLMSPFDKAIGHYRRYSKKMAAALGNEKVAIVKNIYADSIGLFASCANKLLLKQKYPSKKQIHFWDSFMIPISKIIDPLLFHACGKTIITVWRKN